MTRLGARPERIRAGIGPCIAQPSYEVGAGISRFLHRCRSGEPPLFPAGGAFRPFSVRSAGLYRRSPGAARPRRGRADAARHGGRGGAVLQLSARLSARRIGLRPRPRGYRARALTARCPTSSCSVSSVCSAFSRPARCFDRALRPEPLAALALIALAALLASCQPLPHPFADDRPPAELLAVPESAGVSIAPVEGLPGAIAAKLGAATARALLGHDIPASEKTTGHGTYQLYGQLIQSEQGGRSGVAVLWRLEDAKGRQIGEREVAIEGTAEDWQSPRWRDDRARGRADRRRRGAAACQGIGALQNSPPSPTPTSGQAEPDVPPESSPAKPPVPEPLPAKAALPDLASAKPAAPTPPAAASPPRKQEADGSGWPCAA